MSLITDGAYWTVTESVQEPLVQATVQKDFGVGLEEYYQTSPDTHSIAQNYSKLIVPLYCSMILVCESPFPVAWFKDGKGIESDDTINHEFYYHPDLSDYSSNWPNNLRRNHSELYTIKGHQNLFNATLRIKNVTMAMEGPFVCMHQAFHVITLGTVIDIMLDITPGPTLASTEAQILLSVMEESKGFHNRIESLELSFLYFIPRYAECDVYFVLPDKKIVRNHNAGMNIESHEDSAYLRFARLRPTFASRNTFIEEGDYQFVIEQHFENGNKHFVRPFSYKRKLSVRTQVSVAEKLLTDQFGAYLFIGRVYMVTFQRIKPMQMDEFPFDRPIINASIDVFSQMSPSDGCGYKPVLAADATEECGIVSVITGRNVNRFWPFIQIDVILNVTKSCSLKSRVVANDSSVLTMYLNITAVEETFSGKKAEPTVVIIEMPDGGRGSSVKLTNETFQLRCLVPVCDWEVLGWCKIDSGMECARYTWKRDRITEWGIVAKDPTFSVRFQFLNNYTAAIDLLIKSVQLDHSGVYSCTTRMFKPFRGLTYPEYLMYIRYMPYSDTEFDVYYIRFIGFNLTVLEPVKPIIRNARNDVDDFVIKKDGELELFCQIGEGIPTPTITWREYSDDNSFEHENGNNNATLVTSNTNKTSLIVSRPGLFECQANNFLGVARRKFRVNYEQGGGSTIPIAIAILLASAVALSVALSRIGLVAWLKRRNRRAIFEKLHDRIVDVSENLAIHNDKPLNDQADSISYDPTFEIPREWFDLIRILGNGKFGIIFEGVKCDQSGNRKSVAVKVPRDSRNPQHSLALFSEMLIMAKLRPHVNVLSLIGYCTKDIARGKLLVLTELCRLGSLRDYIIKQYDHSAYSSNKELAALEELLTYAYQVANGMEHLAIHTPPILHRDLALRNLLLTTEKVVKVSDFGLSRLDENHYSDNLRYQRFEWPVVWMALESLIEKKFTLQSDVWSFGVVLWEIFSLARIPYARYQLQEVQSLIDWLGEGNRLERPMEHTPDNIYQLMLDCWKKHPNERPAFSECKKRIASSMPQRGYEQLISQLNNSLAFVTNQGNDEHNPELTVHNADLPVAAAFTEVEKSVKNAEEGSSNTPNVDIEMAEWKN